MKKNAKGFTLVELVVVIAIIGVLAAILVPSMMGYVKKSRLKTANGNAKTVYNAVAEFVADQETKGTPIDWTASGNPSGVYRGKDGFNGTTAATDTSGFAAGTSGSNQEALGKIVKNALADNGNEAGVAYVGGHTINGNANAFFVQWKKTMADNMIGQYPEAVADVETSQSGTFGTPIKGTNSGYS